MHRSVSVQAICHKNEANVTKTRRPSTESASISARIDAAIVDRTDSEGPSTMSSLLVQHAIA